MGEKQQQPYRQRTIRGYVSWNEEFKRLIGFGCWHGPVKQSDLSPFANRHKRRERIRRPSLIAVHNPEAVPTAKIQERFQTKLQSFCLLCIWIKGFVMQVNRSVRIGLRVMKPVEPPGCSIPGATSTYFHIDHEPTVFLKLEVYNHKEAKASSLR